LEWADENFPEEFGRALKRELILTVPERLHAESFEINHLIIGLNQDSFVHASMSRLVGH
jgi:hypothetical protein